MFKRILFFRVRRCDWKKKERNKRNQHRPFLVAVHLILVYVSFFSCPFLLKVPTLKKIFQIYLLFLKCYFILFFLNKILKNIKNQTFAVSSTDHMMKLMKNSI